MAFGFPLGFPFKNRKASRCVCFLKVPFLVVVSKVSRFGAPIPSRRATHLFPWRSQPSGSLAFWPSSVEL